jgi:hypothetical protein
VTKFGSRTGPRSNALTARSPSRGRRPFDPLSDARPRETPNWTVAKVCGENADTKVSEKLRQDVHQRSARSVEREAIDASTDPPRAARNPRPPRARLPRLARSVANTRRRPDANERPAGHPAALLHVLANDRRWSCCRRALGNAVGPDVRALRPSPLQRRRIRTAATSASVGDLGAKTRSLRPPTRPVAHGRIRESGPRGRSRSRSRSHPKPVLARQDMLPR